VPENIRITRPESPGTTQTIGRRTDTTVALGKVESLAFGSTPGIVAAQPPETLATNVGAINLFSVTLRDLQPAFEYASRVGDGSHWSPHCTVETEKAEQEEFEYVVFER
jgi:hypothetical protein